MDGGERMSPITIMFVMGQFAYAVGIGVGYLIWGR